jgi:hypothetical protein
VALRSVIDFGVFMDIYRDKEVVGVFVRFSCASTSAFPASVARFFFYVTSTLQKHS